MFPWSWGTFKMGIFKYLFKYLLGIFLVIFRLLDITDTFMYSEVSKNIKKIHEYRKNQEDTYMNM